ncbi:hypothetical protein [Amphibacillus indicireducens]|uniref:Tetratricopeptide repeat protein n=1 Tax=Amphibacillus indicireducens TaxID=1076330 RepID=A0ABP7VQI8_9BACI
MAQINPRLIQAITEQPTEDIPESPTVAKLPGTYAKLINRNKDKIKSRCPDNFFMVKCKSCERKGKYNVGLILVNIDQKSRPEETEPNEMAQTTGYFRCKHCNDAGNWEMPIDFNMAILAGMVMHDSPIEDKRCELGTHRLFDGSWHLYCSDAEEHLLDLLTEEPDNAYLWTRLANLYFTGNRPELTACVLEHALSIDRYQTEARYTLGSFFHQIGELELAAEHYKYMLLSANKYQKMDVIDFRHFLADGLNDLFLIHLRSNQEIPFLPSIESMEQAGLNLGNDRKIVELDFELFPDELESFYPLAEMYMGSLRNRIPKRQRRLTISINQKGKKKRHKKRRK